MTSQTQLKQVFFFYLKVKNTVEKNHILGNRVNWFSIGLMQFMISVLIIKSISPDQYLKNWVF